MDALAENSLKIQTRLTSLTQPTDLYERPGLDRDNAAQNGLKTTFETDSRSLRDLWYDGGDWHLQHINGDGVALPGESSRRPMVRRPLRKVPSLLKALRPDQPFDGANDQSKSAKTSFSSGFP